jgi:hypothetical protein
MQFATLSVAVMFLMSSALAQVKPEPISDREIFLVEDRQHHQWCAYASKSDSRSEAERLKAMVVVGVDYSKGRISAMHVTQWDESGDWSVDDKYSLDQNQKLRTLSRVTDNFSLGITQDQLFQMENGKAIRERSASRASRTGKTTEDLSSDDLPDVAIMTDLQSFPFWPLIRDKRQEVLSKGRVCTAVSSGNR